MLNDTCGCFVTPAPVNIPGPQGPAGVVPVTGTATLVGGTITITAAIDAASFITTQRTVVGGTLGFLVVSTNVAGGTFTVASYQTNGTAQAADTSTFSYYIYG